MATADNVKRAEALTRIGLWVFPVYVRPDETNPYKNSKKPGTANGFYDATNDPGFVIDLFERHPKAEVGVWMGPSGLVAADIDVKRDPEGNILVDGFEEFDKSWLPLPETHSFDSISGAGGKQFIYAAPEGVNLGPAGKYRGIEAVDRRAGNSYSVWVGDVPTSRAVFSEAPEWLLDASTVRSAAVFAGDVRQWYETLEPGEPSLIVRAAMDRTREIFADAGDDFDHAAMIERQFEAVRLGSEGHAGVPELLSLIEELFLSRTGSHSRAESEWEYEFAESLASAVAKYGDAIALRKELPEYSPSVVPASVPDRLFLGTAGKKTDFSALLRALQDATDDDLLVTSILWNAPKTKELSREWGLPFVHQRVQDARIKPEPIKENPSLPDRVDAPVSKAPETLQNTSVSGTFLSAEELSRVEGTQTFINRYHVGSRTKGFTNDTYVPPSAWTALSMAFGRAAFIPLAKSLELNLWFVVPGESTTGKGTEDGFLRALLNLVMEDDTDTYYNLGALSSPDGLHLSLLQRDGMASIIHNDEAADFFRDIRGGKDWMTAVPDKLSKWNDGYVEPSSKISLKDYKGKDSRTSLNLLMWGTPDRMLELMDASQFQSGFLARVNWVWDERKPDPNRKFNLKIQPERKSEIPDAVYDLASDLRHARSVFPSRFGVAATQEAQDRLNRAANEFHAFARKSARYSFFKPAVDRLVMETLWRLAALTALYRGDEEFDLTDALIAVYYGSQWLTTMIKVAESISESPYSRDVELMENFIKEEGGTVTEAKLLHHFRGLIVRSRRELTDRIEFLVESGRLVTERPNNVTMYRING